ncbi:MAG: cytochrome c biogenesis protein ResB [Defluviitaleaceae bacterium]|nr:cytochrome c biogenesis protein ResB [Defluviitaleaceae bacterium]
MKKVFMFVRSMKFGLILLLVVIAFSVAGSLIPQTFEDTWYLENYPSFGEAILALGLHRMFSQWYFIVVSVLLGASLAAAAISRFMALRKLLQGVLVVPESGYRTDELVASKVSRLCTYLQKKRYRELNTGEATVYHKNRIGYFGSALVHLSLLMILVFGGLVLGLSYYDDVLLLPGETAELSDGSTMHLHSFTRRDPITDRIESISVITVSTPDGRTSGAREIRVNHPLRFNSYAFYQFHHLYAGSITATDVTTGGRDTFYLTERSFLSADGRTGIWFETVFQGWTMEEETGRIIPLIYDAPIFPDPLYYVLIMTEHIHEHRFAVPGTHIYVGSLRFDFNELINYPGIRVSFTPHPFPALLLAASALLMVGLFLSFYLTPVIVVIKDGHYKITASKSSGIELEIVAMLYEGEDIPKDTPDDEQVKIPENQEREVDI